MSIIYCEKHDRRWDSDKLDECPQCENEPQAHALPPGLERLYKAVGPFVKLLTNSQGRIPTERLSAADWHELAKAYAEASGPLT